MPRDLCHYPWYPADYRADTAHLTREQDYAYRVILDEIFLKGQHNDPPSILDNEPYLARLTKCMDLGEWRAVRAILIDDTDLAVLVSDGKRISQRRMSAEIARARDILKNRQKAGKARWAAFDAGSKKTDEGISGHGSSGDRGAAKRGNGNGVRMSDKQFLFHAGRVAKWLETNRDLYAGGDGGAMSRAFKRDHGFTLDEWERESAHHQ